MIKRFYTQGIVKFPAYALMLLFLSVAFLSSYIPRLSIDASSETLLLENDPDLQLARQIEERYAGDAFLVIAFSPKAPLLSPQTLLDIDRLSQDLSALPAVKGVTSLLDVPLLQSPPRPIKELVDETLTLRNPQSDKILAQQELLTSPLYRNNLVSPSFDTTAILIHLKADLVGKDLEEKRAFFKQMAAEKPLSPTEKTALSSLETTLKHHRDTQRLANHDTIMDIRTIMSHYASSGKLFLGGVNMIADDLVSFVKSDLLIFGSLLLALLIAALWLIFRQWRWIVIPVLISLLSVLATAGFLGFFGWEVTVISSNFVSLQLIITLSTLLHLMVRYKELLLKYPRSSHHRIVLNTVLSKLSPSLYAIVTTVAGFGSLILSDILPIIHLGWMMSIGIAFSLCIAFIAFPALILLLPKKLPYSARKSVISPIELCIQMVERFPRAIFIASLFIVFIGISGTRYLMVENSFINYFKKETAIYQGMKVIDQTLGGTTPLDVIVRFKEMDSSAANTPAMDEFEAEFEAQKEAEQYWFTPDKIELIYTIHTYLETLPSVGKVLSLATMLDIGKTLNDGHPLDSFQLALLYNKLPEAYRRIILAPYINIAANELRFTMRMIDSDPSLRRNALLRTMREDLARLVPQEKADVHLSGLMVLYNNLLQSLFQSQIVTLGFVILFITLVLWFLFRSFKRAVIAIVSNVVPISTVFGLMGWLGIPLDMMTITIAAIGVGIGIDDTIHYIHRFEHEFAKDHNYLLAMKRSHRGVGYGMYYTTLAIVAGFLVLVFSNFIPTIYFGILTVLMMLSALLAALLLLPRLLIAFKAFTN